MHTKGKGAISGAMDRLKEEIALNRPFRGTGEAAFLATAWTWQCLEALGRTFFPRYAITGAQFNALMILWDYRERPLRQHELADLLVVNRASAGGVIARLERAGWIARVRDARDTRAREVRLTPSGIAKLQEVKVPYYRLLALVFRESDAQALKGHIAFLDAIRSRLRRRGSVPRSRMPRRGL